MKKYSIEQLECLLKTQLSEGNWNYDPYMFGMANGMILIFSLLKGKKPKFKNAPKKWISDVLAKTN